ncbi:MAG: AAA domain-containing protein, partial [Leptolyngbyaceae cyanobacterium SU_3_3]|nr:AAA domain-containing protein [Leptolyngbyaceae cyanobacterium SU_3_3]
MTWKYFNGNCNLDQPQRLTNLPERPPWRQFLPKEVVDKTLDDQYWVALRQLAAQDTRSIQRGKSFRVQMDKKGYSEIVDAVNAAIHLRRPLLVTGDPGAGKTSLAYAIAHELQLGSVLTWPITARANLVDAEYRYDAIARLQDAQLDKTRSREKGRDNSAKRACAHRGRGSGGLHSTGASGDCFLPSLLPRVLLIDEIDKSDLNLPNDLLNLFEEGEFEIPELVRRKRRRGDAVDPDSRVMVRTADKDMEVPIINGRVTCCEFPIVIMTSNGERDFPPAFYRRCLRVKMPSPTPESLLPIVKSHFDSADPTGWTKTQENLTTLIGAFLDKGNKADRATDQLLNAIYLMT